MINFYNLRHANKLGTELRLVDDRQLKQAVAAFSFITIPSIRDCQTRLLLYLESGQVAMMNKCLGQAESCFKAIISNISNGFNFFLLKYILKKKFFLDLNPGHDKWLVEYLPGLLSTVLIVPDNPEEGVLFIIKSSLNSINKYTWDQQQGFKALALISGIRLLATACQETFPYKYEV